MSSFAVIKATSKKASSPALSLSDEAILGALYRYYYLTAKAACRLLFKPGSLIYVQTKLKRLAGLGFIQRCFLPRPTQHGSAPSVYCLSRKGLNHLGGAGIEVPKHYQPIYQAALSYLFLNHSLMVSDVLITAELLAKRTDGVVLETMVHELDLKRTPFHVNDANSERLVVIPDGFLDFRISGQYQACIALEVDRATEEQKKFRRKIRGLVEFTRSGAYQEWAGTTSLTMAIVTTTAPRLQQLRTWSESELEDLGRSYADLFRFAVLTDDMFSPEVMFFQPRWSRPFDDSPASLLEQPT